VLLRRLELAIDEKRRKWRDRLKRWRKMGDSVKVDLVIVSG